MPVSSALDVMNTEISALLSMLHKEWLKPAGFRKQRNVFFRQHEQHIERFSFQISARPGQGAFFLNCGIEFLDEPFVVPWIFLKDTHWGGRIRSVVANTPMDWFYNDATDLNLLATELAGLILQASERFLSRLDYYRAEYHDRIRRIQKMSKNG